MSLRVLGIGLSIGLSYWLIVGLFNGVASDSLNEQRRVVPNQGIRRSAHNGILIGFISGCVIWLIYCLGRILASGLVAELEAILSFGPVVLQAKDTISFMLSSGLDDLFAFGDPINTALYLGCAGGLLVGLLNGGLACIRHCILRWLLWRANSVPWNYPHFLDYASERILLRKVGGGYIFAHQMLLDYFASLDSTDL